MMFPGGIERALGIAEVSDWFDWMRKEISSGGIGLPQEETAVSFAGHALRLRDRIKDVYRHLPISLENRLIESVIVYQCWELHKELHTNSEKLEASWARPLVTVEVERYIRPVGDEWGRHLVEARNGFQYVVTVPTGLDSETTPATEVICNRLLRLLGLPSPDAIVVVAKGTSVRRSSDVRPGRPHAPAGRTPEVCAGFRYLDSPPLDDGQPSLRNLRLLFGAYVFDLWTLNLSTRQWWSSFSEATGRVEVNLSGRSGCLSGGDWQRFLGSTSVCLSASQTVAPEVKRWSQIEPWLRSIKGLDLNPIWELAFQMPPQWYGGRRQLLMSVLDKIESRKWGLKSAVRQFIGMGQLPALRMPASRVEVRPAASRSRSALRVAAADCLRSLEPVHQSQLAEGGD